MDYYSFEIDGENVGYMEQSDEGGVRLNNARMKMGEDIYENPFGIKHDGGKVLAYTYGDEDWIDASDLDDDVFPSAALEEVIKSMGDAEEITYRMLAEGSEEITDGIVVKRDGNTYREFRPDGSPGRYVVFEGDKPVEYGWEAPRSQC